MRPDRGAALRARPDGRRRSAPADAAPVATAREVDPATTAAQIRAFMAGTLDPAVDPSSLFIIDLANPTDVQVLARTLDRSRRPREKGAASDEPTRILVEARGEFLALTDVQA